MRLFFSVLFIFIQLSFAQLANGFCGTSPMPHEQVLGIKNSIEDWLKNNTIRILNDYLEMLFAGKMDLTEVALTLQAGRFYKFKRKKRRVKNG